MSNNLATIDEQLTATENTEGLPQKETDLNFTVSYGTKVNRKDERVTLVPFKDIIEQIKTGSNGLDKTIEQVRSLPCTSAEEKKVRQAYKTNNLPYFSMGTFKDNHRENKNLISIKHVLLDFDDVLPVLDALMGKLRKDRHVLCAFISPGGDGIKVIFPLDRAVTNYEEYRKIYVYYMKKYTTLYGVKPDAVTKDAARACYLSYDPDIYINANCEPLSADVEEEQDPGETVEVKESAEDLLKGTIDGHRTERMTKLIGSLIAQRADEQTILELVQAWNQRNTPPLPDDKICKTVSDMYQRYFHKTASIPVEFTASDNAYYKTVHNGQGFHRAMVTTFTIEPKELLVLDDSDCLRCNATSTQGFKYEDIFIENTDWHTKSKLLKAIGHQDCTFHGSDNDVQALCSFINTHIPVRKRGTKVIGLIDDLWVTEGVNITASGIQPEQTIVPFGKGADAFYHGIKYPEQSEEEYKEFMRIFYENILHVNDEKVIVPWLSWIFVSPLKPVLMDKLGGFPLVFVHGSQGSGKTTTGKMFKRLCGYTDYYPTSCTQRTFPMLKLLSSTNAIPVVLDEFKVADMKDDERDNLIRMMRKSYAGEVESKGRPDQTVEDYHLQAPMTVMGEWNITQPAIKERVLLIRFSDTVKKNKSMQNAFDKLWELRLEGFMPRYIEFVLQQDVAALLEKAKIIIAKQFKKVTVAPRILNNLIVMVMGIMLFQLYAQHWNIAVPEIKSGKLLKDQLSEITGSKSGFVKSAIDQLLEEFSVLAQNGELEANRDFKTANVDLRNKKSLQILAIRFNKVFPDFKIYAQRTNYEGDLLDKESYLRLFDECEYVVGKSYAVKFNDGTHRCVCIDIVKVKKQDLDLEGFGI
ncbi:MAG: BT4734/BF3469 family protein [Bacteroidota bacterium]|jgi:hypothetical protein